MGNFIKGFATVLVCGILIVGCTASTSSNVDAEEQMEVQFIKIGEKLSRAVDCRTGVVLYKYHGYSITSEKIDQNLSGSFGCAGK